MTYILTFDIMTYIITVEYYNIHSQMWTSRQAYILTYEYYDIHYHIWIFWHTFSNMNIMTYSLIYDIYGMHPHIWTFWYTYFLIYEYHDIYSNKWTFWHSHTWTLIDLTPLWVPDRKIKGCLWNTTICPQRQQNRKKAIFSFKVKVKVTRSLTLVSFERASLVEYAIQIKCLYLLRFKSYSEG